VNKDYNLDSIENESCINCLVRNIPEEIGLEEKLYLIY